MGDIWVVSINGGVARRLTDSRGNDFGPLFWSEDGKYVFFVSDRYGNNDIFRMQVAGNEEPKRLTYHPADDRILFVKDGYVYFSSRRTEYRGAIYRVSEEGGMPERVWNFEVNSMTPAGPDTFYFERGFTRLWRRKYRGSANRDIWFMSGDSMKKIAHFPGRDACPMYSKYDKKLYFISNDNQENITNLYVMNTDGTQRKEIAHFKDDIGCPFMSYSGRKIVFTVMGKIYVFDIPSRKLDSVSIILSEDKKFDNPYYRHLKSQATEIALSERTGEIAFVLFGDIYVMKLNNNGEPIMIKRITYTSMPEKNVVWNPVKEELVFASLRDGNWNLFSLEPIDDSLVSEATSFKVKRLTSSPSTEKSPVFSPDGKYIAFKKNQGTLYVMNNDGSEKRRISPYNDVLWVSWSWDSKYLAFSRTALGWREDIYVVKADGSQPPVNISQHPNDDYKPMWSYDGRRLEFASRDENGNLLIKYVVLRKEDAGKDENYFFSLKDSLNAPGEVKIDFDDIQSRVRTVYRFQGDYNYWTQDKWGLVFAVEAEDLGGDDIWKVNIKGEGLKRLTYNTHPKMFLFDKSGNWIYYLSGKGRVYRVNLRGDKKPLPFSEYVEIDYRHLRKALFTEMWWLLNDGFYDPNFHGVNWKELYKKYLPFAQNTYNREEFYDIVRLMLGELNASHLGVWGKYTGIYENYGLLGGEYVRVKDGFRIKRVIYDSPLYLSGLKKGDVLLGIDEIKLDTVKNIYSAMRWLSGKKIKIKYKRGNKENYIKLKPQPFWKIRELLYKEWVRGNRRFVDSLSGGRLAYIHIPSMDLRSVSEFKKDLYAQRDKKGLILDIRYNGGGSTHDIILNILRRTRYLYSIERGKNEKEYSSLFSWDKPIVLVINSLCYSDAEIFPAGFRQLGLGKIVGTPTFGAVIGTNNVKLFDAETTFRVPEEGWYRLNGKSLELGPVSPDIYVENPPIYDNITNDPQLRRAVSVLLSEIK